MNEMNNQPSQDGSLPQQGAAAPVMAVSPSRRKLIKLGAASVPVVATLASSPAMAWDCKTPSAWGSAVVRSQKTTAAHTAISSECWYVSQWQAGADAPWQALQKKCNKLYTLDPTKKTKDLVANITLQNLVDYCGVVAPIGSTLSDKAVAIFADSKDSDYIRCVIVAQLNAKCGRDSANIAMCIAAPNNSNQLQTMARSPAGYNFKPSGGGTGWDHAKIASYLKANYLAAL